MIVILCVLAYIGVVLPVVYVVGTAAEGNW